MTDLQIILLFSASTLIALVAAFLVIMLSLYQILIYYKNRALFDLGEKIVYLKPRFTVFKSDVEYSTEIPYTKEYSDYIAREAAINLAKEILRSGFIKMYPISDRFDESYMARMTKRVRATCAVIHPTELR